MQAHIPPGNMLPREGIHFLKKIHRYTVKQRIHARRLKRWWGGARVLSRGDNEATCGSPLVMSFSKYRIFYVSIAFVCCPGLLLEAKHQGG